MTTRTSGKGKGKHKTAASATSTPNSSSPKFCLRCRTNTLNTADCWYIGGKCVRATYGESQHEEDYYDEEWFDWPEEEEDYPDGWEHAEEAGKTEDATELEEVTPTLAARSITLRSQTGKLEAGGSATDYDAHAQVAATAATRTNERRLTLDSGAQACVCVRGTTQRKAHSSRIRTRLIWAL